MLSCISVLGLGMDVIVVVELIHPISSVLQSLGML